MAAFLMLVATACLSSCQETAGATNKQEPPLITVRYLAGDVVYLHNGEEAPLTRESLLSEGDEIITRSDSMVVLKLDDTKQVQIAPDSRIEITNFKRSEEGEQTFLSLHEGNIINILDEPLEDNDSYEVETPSLIMAIRGTIASVSSSPEAGCARVLLFEGSSLVSNRSSDEEVNVSVGSYASCQDGQLGQGEFTEADLNQNEYWFLYEAGYSLVFDEPKAKIAERLAPLLTRDEYHQEVAVAEQSSGYTEEGAAEIQNPEEASSYSNAPSTNESTPDYSQPSPSDSGGGTGMSESSFRALEQEFLEAKENYNKGRIGKDEFLSIKQRYIDAKQQYYGG